jgi:C-terminal processing protease CtpA/Prc
MRHLLLAAVLCATAIASGAAQKVVPGRELEATLTFETTHTASMPSGWGGGPPSTIFVDGDTVHSGRWAARLERTNTAGGQPFSALTRSIPVDFGGTLIEWRGFLRSEDVSDFMGLWMRQDGDTPNLAFATMQPQQIKGTNGWMEYSIAFPLHRDARQLYFGVLLGGSGKVWADDLRLLVDGKPVWEAPKAERPKTPLELDHQFDSGSAIAISELSPMQIENLATLGKVWGFLKYHHPAVTGGSRHWDYDLFRALPGVLSARDRQTGDRAIYEWARQLGTPPICNGCAAPASDDVHLLPDLRWIDRTSVDLAGLLRAVHNGRSQGRQFYVSQVPNIGNPQFEREPAYATLTFPDAGYQLLALYRFWNTIEYWFPHRDQLDDNWDTVLAEFVPRVALAKDNTAYQLEMLALIARVTDTHANLYSAPPELPLVTRFIEGQAVVTGYANASGPPTGLQIGDIVESLDGTTVQDLVKSWSPYFPASNQPTRLRDMARVLTRGPCATVRVAVRRPSGATEITAERQPLATLDRQAGLTHDLPGDTFRLLSDQVAYLKLSSVKVTDAASYVERSKGTRGLIIDIRNYPSEFVVFALGSLLVEQPTPFTRITAGDLDNPGAFIWRTQLSLTPQQPHYPGKVVVLVDEMSLSQAEYTALAFRAAPQTTVVGSTTAGADGNVSQIVLPGGLRTAISGIGIFYPDKRPTQRIGIVPDVEVRPTIAGIRAGRDEVLEEGMRQILGPNVPADQIHRIAAPPR